MAAWTDLSAIETPPRIASLPKDERGYPIFFTLLVGPDGKPNFRAQDPYKWEAGVHNSLCGICGQKLGKKFAFVGGPRSIKSRYFTDLPMHESCAVYALKACPFIAMPKFTYLTQHAPELAVNPLVSDKRPEMFGIGITSKMKVVQLQGHTVIRAGTFTRVQFWKDGKPI
ncbi:hypothetical protein GC387_33380 [Pseudomonas sp. MWU12-2323]|nr:hypothetical protein [Pseudomonas sp. MWU12-2323]